MLLAGWLYVSGWLNSIVVDFPYTFNVSRAGYLLSNSDFCPPKTPKASSSFEVDDCSHTRRIKDINSSGTPLLAQQPTAPANPVLFQIRNILKLHWLSFTYSVSENHQSICRSLDLSKLGRVKDRMEAIFRNHLIGITTVPSNYGVSQSRQEERTRDDEDPEAGTERDPPRNIGTNLGRGAAGTYLDTCERCAKRPSSPEEAMDTQIVMGAITSVSHPLPNESSHPTARYSAVFFRKKFKQSRLGYDLEEKLFEFHVRPAHPACLVATLSILGEESAAQARVIPGAKRTNTMLATVKDMRSVQRRHRAKVDKEI
ncbi:hypothetical protein BKA64DRAFT_649616 [Cadophora sp. MPI-SDFR-AT-0126]|nr:hypothetical protein BKA64DRAFT_649616 [Leotiomycetes sp. MPI-SDFR-AT-0126]